MTDKKNDKILIVDDNPANLGVLSECLGKYEFEVLIAQNGESAIQKASYVIPDLIILDIMMPGIDGFETCKRLKKNPNTQNIPIILMTALSDIENKIKGLKSGAVDYITKPFQQEEVLARINIHLNVHHLTQKLQERNTQLQQEIKFRNLSEEKLKKTLEDLTNTQVKLVQSEKISGLGRVVAGICHEFNNPIGFITGNIQFLRSYIDKLVAAVEDTKVRESQLESSKLLITEEDTAHDDDLEYIIDDIPKVLRSIESGTDRIVEIIDRLKMFSYLDQSGKKMLDIHEVLERVISLISYRLQSVTLDGLGVGFTRPEIKVVRDYDQLPLVYCYPDQINQVFLNLVTNAIDAIDAMYESSKAVDDADIFLRDGEPKGPLLLLKTKHSSTHISIHVIDNGIGIPSDIQAQVFDPFFTTKAVGKGVGLGLAICFQIVTEMHGGCLHCISSSAGTEMVIELPLDTDDSAS